MFPGRFPNVPESMWNFGWTPQTMGLQGQFCGGDVMNQQSQAQSQAQTQAQLAHLREQNSILNQQLASQAQSHIQHLQQLLSFHQSTSTPPPPHSTSQASEPPTPVAPTSTQPGSSVSFNPEEIYQGPTNVSQVLSPFSASPPKVLLSGFRSRCHIVIKGAFPEFRVRQGLDQLIHLYTRAGFPKEELHAISNQIMIQHQNLQPPETNRRWLSWTLISFSFSV